MELKNYQRNALSVIRSFFENCRIAGPKAAFNAITTQSEIATRLAGLNNSYIEWETIPPIPRICIKVPTGGGKTLLAAHSIKIVGETWREIETPLVLWFVPSDTIRRQTVEALKNSRHPYRKTLDEQFNGRVQIFDLDEKFIIRPADISENTCIIVSTMQSFVKENTNKYNVYRDNENLEPHFAKINPSRFNGMEMNENNVRPKYSFANLLYFHRPVMIIDEAHKVVTNLSQETLKRINPAAIVEFTATPQQKNNTLYNVHAVELKDEETIKLPVALRVNTDWETIVTEAIQHRAKLEEHAVREDDYIRPIILFQAQNINQVVNTTVLKNFILEHSNIPENQIKIATGEQKELDNIDLFNPNEPTRFIITVEALKEGWDCSFAYILCSLVNIKSDTSVIQLLGRVMRMPYAKKRKSEALNKAYAFVVSPHFDEAAFTLTEKLVERGGFGNAEARAVFQEIPLGQPGLNQNWTSPLNQFITSAKLCPADIPPSVQLKDGDILFFTSETNDADIQVICTKLPSNEASDLLCKYAIYKKQATTPSPASMGFTFSVPRLMFEVNGETLFADPVIIFERFDWNIAEYVPPQLDVSEFAITGSGKNYVIDIDGNRLKYSASETQSYFPQFSEIQIWPQVKLIHWLDDKLRQEDIPQPQMLEWLRRNIDFLVNKRKIDMSQLMVAKYVLYYKLLSKVTEARKKAKNKSFELFERDARKTLDFANGFIFRDGMYDGEPCYEGNYKFQKHFLGSNKIPAFDGAENGEEFQCAQALDDCTEVKHWVRNVSGHRNSFKLPTSTDFFYPDFVAELNDGRLFVTEYKGAYLSTTDDTKEKVNIGGDWEMVSKGKMLFLLAVIEKGGKSLAEQIKEKMRVLSKQ
jgi:type III restriction enzyme